jgi:hypothetical protein
MLLLEWKPVVTNTITTTTTTNSTIEITRLKDTLQANKQAQVQTGKAIAIASRALGNYRLKEIELRKEYERLDRELAMLDGRYKVIPKREPASEKRPVPRASKDDSRAMRDVLSLMDKMDDSEKAALFCQLMGKSV